MASPVPIEESSDDSMSELSSVPDSDEMSDVKFSDEEENDQEDEEDDEEMEQDEDEEADKETDEDFPPVERSVLDAGRPTSSGMKDELAYVEKQFAAIKLTAPPPPDPKDIFRYKVMLMFKRDEDTAASALRALVLALVTHKVPVEDLAKDIERVVGMPAGTLSSNEELMADFMKVRTSPAKSSLDFATVKKVRDVTTPFHKPVPYLPNLYNGRPSVADPRVVSDRIRMLFDRENEWALVDIMVHMENKYVFPNLPDFLEGVETIIGVDAGVLAKDGELFRCLKRAKMAYDFKGSYHGGSFPYGLRAALAMKYRELGLHRLRELVREGLVDKDVFYD